MTDDRRGAMLDRLADHVLANGLAASSLRPLGRAAGTSDRMLLYYFADKTALMAAVIERIADRMTALLAARTHPAPLPLRQLRPLLVGIVLAPDLWPYMALWLEIASLSARGDALYRGIGERIGRGFLAWGRAQLASDGANAETDAAALLVAIEGSVLLASIGMGDEARITY